MNRLFYDHLIVYEELIAVLDEHSLSPKDREHIFRLVDTILEHEILDLILTYLPEDKHEQFIQQLHKAPHNREHIAYLRQHAHPDIERILADHAKTVLAECVIQVRHAAKTRKEP